jgi:hypothetical protein
MCLWCRNLDKKKNNPKYKKHFYYEKAERKLQNELDIVTLLKSIRNQRLIN